MKNLWESILGLDEELSIWVEEDDLGREKLISHRKRDYYVKIPQKINKQITLRLKGLGKTRFHKTGDLYLHLWLNKKGEDITKSLWISEAFAKNGGEKNLTIEGERIIMAIPSKSYHGLTIRRKGFGAKPLVDPRAPALLKKIYGNLLVKLFVYPDQITPYYGLFDTLSTEDMYLEGWVFRKFDEVISILGRASLPTQPIRAETIADLFNERGWMGIFDALVDYLKLTNLKIERAKSSSLSKPGECLIMAESPNNSVFNYTYRITVKEQFLDDPFLTAAILAHELCHVVYEEKIDHSIKKFGSSDRSEKDILEVERTIDLMVFIFKMSEFQLRAAKSKGFIIGYFDQEVFERMQVIVSRKLNSFSVMD